MRKLRNMTLILLLCLSLVPAATAETPPASQGAVTDLAGVLGEQTIQDLTELSARLKEKTGGALYVVTRHFLGGAQTAAYGETLFDAWNLDERDALLLLVVGEEKYALTLGDRARVALPADTQTSLLATHFRAQYLNRAYDAAVAELALAFTDAIAKAEGASVSTAGLLGSAAIQSTPQPQTWESLWQGMFSESEDAPVVELPREEEESRTNWRAIIIWGLVIYFLFFRKKRRYDFGHGPKKRR